MPIPVYAAQQGGDAIYKIGRVGYDSGNTDAGGAYTGVLRSERISPLGENGRCKFRRVTIRALTSGTVKCKLKVFVDNAQTELWDSSLYLQLTDIKKLQEVEFELASAEDSLTEQLLEADINAVGTFIEAELTILSTDVVGTFLPEEIQVSFAPLSPARQAQVGYTAGYAEPI